MIKEMAIGFVIGLIAPLVMVYGYYLYDFQAYSFEGFISRMRYANVLSALFSLCSIINLGIFWLFLRKDKYNYCKGIIFGTFPYAAYIIWVKVGI